MSKLSTLPVGKVKTLVLSEDPDAGTLRICRNGDAPMVTLSYNVGLITTRLRRRWASETRDAMFLAEALTTVVTEWDIEKDDGSLVPLTVEGVLDFGVGLLTALFGAIFEDATPGKATGADSSTSSEQPVPSTPA